MVNYTIDKYLKQVDILDLYITKNICKIIKKKKELKFIESNIFLLGFLNKNRKNSLNILLENQEYSIVKKLIKSHPIILNYHNKAQINLFQSILLIEDFYDLILEILNKYNYDLVLKIVTNKDLTGYTSVDILVGIISVNTNRFLEFINKNTEKSSSFEKIKKMLKLISNLDREDLTLVITKLCKSINNSELLLNILEYMDLKNIDIYPDSMMLTCVDTLLLKEDYLVLRYLIPRINYIYFVNNENNFLFNFIDNINKYENINKEAFVSLIFEILSKSNISKIKNIKNENIFFKIFSHYKLNPNIIKKYLHLIDIYETNIFGQNIYSILKLKYSNEFKIKNKKENIIEIDFKKLLEPTDIGIFRSDILHNMLYTEILLSKYSDLIIPHFYQTKEYNETQYELFNQSNNEKFIMSLLKTYFYYFNPWLPFIIIWKNRNNYYFDEHLLNSLLENKQSRYIYIRLTLNLFELDNGETLKHANVIIVDNKKKIVERFEPYGEFNYYNSDDINGMIKERIAKTLGYEFKFVQPYPGFQTRSDEFNKVNRAYGDPNGFCLAWCILYTEIKIQIDMKLDKNNQKYKNVIFDPIKCINYYIINKFKKDYPELEKYNSNMYMIFIRYYAKKLDSEKTNLLKKLQIDPNILYISEINDDQYRSIIKKINTQIDKNCIKNKK